jgi:hypothetical protein
MPERLTKAQVEKIRFTLLPQAFNPAGPISRKDMFKGRKKQIDISLDSIFQPDQHLVIIGERGVGKTSLATIIYDLVRSFGNEVPGYWYGKVNCGVRETFSSLWKSAFTSVRLTREKRPIGFLVSSENGADEVFTLGDTIDEKDLSPSRIVTLLRSGVTPFLWTPYP